MLFQLGYGSVYNAKYIAVDGLSGMSGNGQCCEGEFQSHSYY